MLAGVQTREWSGSSRRQVARFELSTPVDVTVLRSGVPDSVPGRALNLGERGMAAMIAAELIPGESVGIELRLPARTDPLRARALVRYQDKLRCGLEFVSLLAEQRTAIRDWVKNTRPLQNSAATADAEKSPRLDYGQSATRVDKRGTRSTAQLAVSKKRRKASWLILSLVIATCLAVSWWRWNQGWEKLESGLKTQVETPQIQVAAEAMQKLLVHRADPVYPPEAREAKLEGVIAVDIVVGRDGSVVSMRALNGPDVLARAAMNALRWWRFQPYLVNGRPAVVETTVAVEFKP